MIFGLPIFQNEKNLKKASTKVLSQSHYISLEELYAKIRAILLPTQVFPKKKRIKQHCKSNDV